MSQFSDRLPALLLAGLSLSWSASIAAAEEQTVVASSPAKTSMDGEWMWSKMQGRPPTEYFPAILTRVVIKDSTLELYFKGSRFPDVFRLDDDRKMLFAAPALGNSTSSMQSIVVCALADKDTLVLKRGFVRASIRLDGPTMNERTDMETFEYVFQRKENR